MRTLKYAAGAAALSFLMSGTARAQELYDTPIWADDLAPGERLHIDKPKHGDPGHAQEWGYDILGLRHTTGRGWSRKLAGRSGDGVDAYVLYNKPVHAMSAGTVIACWRNAPEDLTAGKPFHPDFDRNLIPGGGNFLLIQEDDGERVDYSHAKPGSIPARLCPNNQALLPTAWRKEDFPVPPATLVTSGARVSPGELLMRVGNSGHSYEPHVHIHKADATSYGARKLHFRRGLHSPWTDGGADLNQWTSFAGSPYPEKVTVIWPPSRLGGEVAAHAYPSADFGRLFLHLHDSGYQLSTLDTYSVGGRSFMNFAWRPASAGWRSSVLVDEAAYQAHIESDGREGWDPVQIESSLDGAKASYSVISVKDKPGTWLARHNLTYDQHKAVMEEAQRSGLSPASISVVSFLGDRRYTVLYSQDDRGSTAIQSQIRESEYQKEFDAQKAAGRHPIHLNSYMHMGQPYIAAIFAAKAGTGLAAGYGMSGSAYQAAYERHTGNGLRTRTVTSFDAARRDHRFAAVWATP